MIKITLQEFADNTEKYFALVHQQSDPIYITGETEKDTMVLITYEEYERICPKDMKPNKRK